MTRKVTEQEKAMLLALEEHQLNYDLFISFFGSTMNRSGGKVTKKASKFEPTDILMLKKGEYFNKTDIQTTVGRFLFNKFIVEKDLQDVVGYINVPVDGDKLNDIESDISKALLNDTITSDQMVRYLNHIQWLAMQLHTLICGSYTLGVLKPIPAMQKHRDKRLKEEKSKLDSGDVLTAVKIEKECLDIAVKHIENDPGMDLFRAKARGNIGNNYKNISVMKGPVYNPNTGVFELVQSNFMEGVRKEELAIHGNAIVTGGYPKAIGTATSGYFSKQLTASMQAVVLDAPGTDCKTKHTVQQKITKQNMQGIMQRYIVDKGKLTLLTEKNISSYMGKVVEMRSPSMCGGSKICSKCAGEMYYLLGVKNIGLTSSRVASTTLKMKMKKFHDATAKTREVVLDDMFI